MPEPIGLSELIEYVKSELMSQSNRENSPSLLFVESVELELHVTASREGNSGVRVDVLSIGGGNISGSVNQENSHIIKVKLSPLFEREQLLEWHKDLHGNEVMPSLHNSLNAFIKGKLDIDSKYNED